MMNHAIDILNANKLNVVLVEDDTLLRHEIAEHLTSNDFNVYALPDSKSLSDLVLGTEIDLYVIDLNLPGETGLSLSKRIRAQTPHVGIVIITAKLGLSDKLASYSHGGADFYLNKPISPDELVLILQNLGRRIRNTHQANEWTLNLRSRLLQGVKPNQQLSLTNREKMLLVALIQAKNNCVESGYLCDLFTKNDSDGFMSKHALEEMIARLKRKFKAIEENDKVIIKSVWGVGYELCIPINITQ